MDLYVAINLGQYGNGEKNLPDDIDTLTAMGWSAVVAVYDSRNGRVYVDTNPNANSTDFGQDLAPFGVQVRDQNHPEGFLGAYFNSQLDAVEFAIHRQALIAAGWNGIDAADLRFHVYTTKEGTSNNPPGAGDLGGRSDIRDTVYDDRLAEDHWREQSSLDHILRTGISRNGNHDRGKRAKVALLVHGNQAIQPASVMHGLINNGQGAGYHRVLDPHAVYGQPLNLHVTATLASALQWASVDPAANKPWLDGPAFNARIAGLAHTGVVHFLATTFSDPILPYFTPDFIADNVELAHDLIREIYGVAPSPRVFWTPERVVDNDVLRKVRDLGYTHTFIDQMRHVLKWYGRTSALTDDGYRIQRISPGGGGDVNAFVINDQASTFRFDNHDQGLGLPLRRLFSKKARSGLHDQVVILFYNWEDFGNKANADAYDRLVRWMANQPWIELVSLDDVAAGAIDLSYPPDGNGDPFSPIVRGANPALDNKVSHDYIDHATDENYDNWYLGSALEEGLHDKVFQHRPGQDVPKAYGMLYTSGIIADTWDLVKNIQHPGLRDLARGTLHASVFQTAFHNQANNNLSKFSTGEYVWRDNSFENLADFAAVAQSRSRMAALYAALDAWALSGTNGVAVVSADVDLDGEDEILLYNDRVAALFERLGGRMTGFWMRYPLSGRVYQLIGPFSSYAGRPTEEEGVANVLGGAVDAHQTSGLKDWYADLGGSGQSYVNDLYSVVLHANGLTLTSGDGKIAKTISLDADATDLLVSYSLDPSIGTLFLRHGMSPGLRQLWGRGQASLGSLGQDGARVSLSQFLGEGQVELGVELLSNVVWNPLASDRDPAAVLAIDAPPMRNQAHTHQVELSGTGPGFQFRLGGDILDPDSDEDGLPDAYELLHPDLDPLNPDDAFEDADEDGASNTDEFIAGTDPGNAADRPEVRQIFPHASGEGFEIRIPTQVGRQYRIFYQDVLDHSPTAWTEIPISPIQGDGSVQSYVDDGTHTDPGPDSPLVHQRFYYLLIEKP